jgi:N-acyl-D-amino-acid deacylase
MTMLEHSSTKDRERMKAVPNHRCLGQKLVVLFTLLLAMEVGSSAGQTSLSAGIEYDVVIRNGRVLDGAGNPWIRADVAIRDGRFVKIGQIKGRGAKEIDASGDYVSPGWIDMMDQSGPSILKNGLAQNKLMEGVTTAISGELGAPVAADQLASYFTDLQKSGISLNFGTYYSEAQPRESVLGEANRPPNNEELIRMKAMVAQAMQAGALGLTAALIYPPATYAQTDEITELARVAAQYGGIYASHIRDEGKDLVPAVDELIDISETAGLPAEVFHFKVMYQPGWSKLLQEAASHIEAARARGVDVAADLYLYTASGTSLDVCIPSWAQEGGHDAFVKRLADPVIRERLKREIITGIPGWSDQVLAAGGWQNVVLANAANPANDHWNGMTITDIAKETGKDPADVAFDLVAQGKGRVTAIYHIMSEQDIQTALRYSWTSIGSDSGISLVPPVTSAPQSYGHPRGYGNFPRVIARYVRDEHTLTLEDAIRKMTSWPATRMRIMDRGLIREGMWADVTIFNYEKVQDRATYKAPQVYPDGVDYVLVNGQVVIDHGKHTGARPGHIIYGPGRTATEYSPAIR